MALLDLYAAKHETGARYEKFEGELRPGEYIRVVAIVDLPWMQKNASNQGCVRFTDMTGEKSIRFGRSTYSDVDLCGYNKDRRASEGVNLAVITVYAKEAHIGVGITIEARCVNPVSGDIKYINIPVVKE